MYELTDQNYLRGIQATDANGSVTFLTAFPGCYRGRVPHLHLEIYPSLARATAAEKVRTTQLALPTDTSSAVYATAGYATSAANLGATSSALDGIFSDGVDLQLP